MRIKTNNTIIRDFERKDANIPSCHLAEKCSFELFEKRIPIGHKQPNMENDSYFYYRRYRNLV